MTKKELDKLSDRLYRAFYAGLQKNYKKQTDTNGFRDRTSKEDSDFIEREEASAKLNAGDIASKGRDE